LAEGIMRLSVAALFCTICSACAGSSLRPADTPPAPPSRPLALHVEESTGASHEEVAALLAPATGALEVCAPGVPLTVRVRLSTQTGSLTASLEPGTSLDPVLRECVLEALSTVNLQGDGENTAVPRPSRFTSLLSISF
jgi:hypothetical protein